MRTPSTGAPRRGPPKTTVQLPITSPMISESRLPGLYLARLTHRGRSITVELRIAADSSCSARVFNLPSVSHRPLAGRWGLHDGTLRANLFLPDSSHIALEVDACGRRVVELSLGLSAQLTAPGLGTQPCRFVKTDRPYA
jgi:hypothetical protein